MHCKRLLSRERSHKFVERRPTTTVRMSLPARAEASDLHCHPCQTLHRPSPPRRSADAA